MKKSLIITLAIMLISMIYFLMFSTLITSIPVIIIGMVLIWGIDNIPNRPPHIAILTRWNKKIWSKNGRPMVLKEGYTWIFLKKIMYDILLISTQRRIRKIDPQNVITPDNINIEIPLTLEWNINEDEIDKFIEIGEDVQVDEHNGDILEGGLREYSRSTKEGPMSWKEMISSGLKVLDFLAKSLCPSEENPPDDGYDHFEKIDDDIPTPILLDYVQGNEPSNALVRKIWGDGKDFKEDWDDDFEVNWAKLLTTVNQLGKDIDLLKDKVRKRKILLEKIKNGKARIKIANTGAYLQRLTVGDVKPFGDIYLAEIELEKEERQAASETYEVAADTEKANLQIGRAHV